MKSEICSVSSGIGSHWQFKDHLGYGENGRWEVD